MEYPEGSLGCQPERPNLHFAALALLIFYSGFAFRSAAAALQKKADVLKVADVLFEDYSGWLSPSFQMKAGGDVVLTFRVQGFSRLPGKSESGLPEDRVSLQYEIELRDPQGVLVQPAGRGEVETTVGPRDDQWTPKIRWAASVPASAPIGNYQIQIRVNDRIAGQNVAEKVSFRVQGEAFQPAGALQVQQVEYARSEKGPWFAELYFSLRDRIHVRHKIVGFGVSAEQEVWVEQDWTVLDAEGRTVVAQGNASVEKFQSFYPPRFLSTLFDLNLQDPRPGAYTLRIAVRDRIGQQTASLDSRFVLRP